MKEEQLLTVLCELMKNSRQSDHAVANELTVSQPTITHARAELEGTRERIRAYSRFSENKLRDDGHYSSEDKNISFQRRTREDISEKLRMISIFLVLGLRWVLRLFAFRQLWFALRLG
jgi:hypothetical protein